MTATFDFSDIIFTERVERHHAPGLSPSDTAVVRWFGRLVVSREEGRLEAEHIAWFAARLITHGGVLVWLAQQRELVERGLCDVFLECAELVPEPWAGFLRWAGDPVNLESFRAWEPYTSDDNLDSWSERGPRPRPRGSSKRRR